MSETKVAKITISLPQTLVELADRLARERATSRSAIIAGLLKDEKETRMRALMAEGYREMREENHAEAEEAISLTREVALRNG